MSVADYVLAGLCMMLCGAWAAFSLLVAAIDGLVPSPCQESARIGRCGCVSLLLAIAAFAYFLSVLWTGQWGWR